MELIERAETVPAEKPTEQVKVRVTRRQKLAVEYEAARQRISAAELYRRLATLGGLDRLVEKHRDRLPPTDG